MYWMLNPALDPICLIFARHWMLKPILEPIHLQINEASDVKKVSCPTQPHIGEALDVEGYSGSHPSCHTKGTAFSISGMKTVWS
jgi:hypothetical protein